jgi:hypothetical protein
VGDAKIDGGRVALDLEAVVDGPEQARRLAGPTHHGVHDVQQRDVREGVGTGPEGVDDGRAEGRRAARIVGEPFQIAAGGVRPVSDSAAAELWLRIGWCRPRTRASRPMTGADSGRCSQTRTPGTTVAIVWYSPRISAGASGLGSNVSRCDGPP